MLVTWSDDTTSWGTSRAYTQQVVRRCFADWKFPVPLLPNLPLSAYPPTHTHTPLPLVAKRFSACGQKSWGQEQVSWSHHSCCGHQRAVGAHIQPPPICPQRPSVWEVEELTKLISASLVVQWLRILLPMQGMRVQSLVQEDSSCHNATKPQ